MAAKLNTKFLLIVGSIVLVLVAVLGGLWVLQVRQDATRHVRAAEAAESAGDLELARQQWGRAIGKDPTNIEYMDRYEALLRQEVPTAIDEIRGRLQELLQINIQRAQARPREIEHTITALELLEMSARLFDGPEEWGLVADRASQFSVNFPEGSPESNAIESIIVRAQGRRAAALTTTELDELIATAERLIAASEPSVTLSEGYVHLLAQQANEQFASGASVLAREVVAKAQEHLDGLPSEVRAHPFVAEGERNLLRELLRAGDDVTESFAAMRDRLAASVSPTDDPFEVIAAALLMFGSEESDRERAAALLEASIEQSDDDLLQLVRLQRLYRFTNRPRAIEVSRAVIDADPRPTGPFALFQRQQSDALVSEIISILYDQTMEDQGDIERLKRERVQLEATIARDGDPDGALAAETAAIDAELAEIETRVDGAVERLRDARDELVARIGVETDDRIERANALVALVDGRPREAAAIFARIFETGSRSINTVENRIYAARAAIELGEFGDALAQLDAGMRLRQTDPRLLAFRANVLMVLGRFEEADTVLTAFEEASPGNPVIAELRAELDARVAAASAGGANPAAGDASAFVRAAQAIQDAVGRGESDQARDLAAAILEDYPDDVRAWRIRSQTELMVGEDETAADTARVGLERFPNDSVLLQTQVLASSEDPLERIDGLARMAHGGDGIREANPKAIDAGRLNGLLRFELIERFRDPEAAERARVRAEELFPVVVQNLPPDQPALIEGLWSLLTELDRDDQAAQVLAAARTTASDPSLAVLLEARTAFERAELEQAVAIIEEAESRRISSALLDRVKGMTLSNLGDVDGAVEAFQSAYERDPVDLRNLLFYTQALRDQGRAEEALDILRTARRATGIDRRVREFWLALETEIGDQRMAFDERFARYLADPRDVDNSLSLADQLINGPVDRRDVVDPRRPDRLLYDAGSWNRLSAQQRAGLLTEARENRRRTALDVLEKLAEVGAPDISAPGLVAKARVLADLSRLDEARATLARLDERHTALFNATQWIRVGETAFEVGDESFGAECFANAREDQRGVEVDRALVEAWRRVGRPGEALRVARAIAASDEATDEDRLVVGTLLAAGGDLDAARAMLEQLTPAGRDAFATRIFRADLAVAAARAAFNAGDSATGAAEVERALADLEAAAPLDPDNPQPLQRQVGALQLLAQGNPTSPAFPRAEEIARRAVALRPSVWGSNLQLAETIVAQGRMDDAIEVLSTYVERFPRRAEARRTLANIYVQAGFAELAIRTLDDGASLGGDPVPWYEAITALHLRLGDVESARTTARRAFETRSDVSTMRLLIDTLTRGEPAYEELVRVVTDNRTIGRDDPVAQAAIAAALATRGELERAEVTYRRAWELMGDDRADARELLGYLQRIHPASRVERGEALLMAASGDDPGVYGYRLLGRLWASRGPDFTEQALERFERAAAAAGDDRRLQAEVSFDVGSVRYAAGDCAGAIEAFERSLELRPDEPSVLNNVAYLRTTCLDDPEGALPSAQRAVALVPGNASFQDTLSVVHYELGDMEKAAEHARESVEAFRGAGNTLHLARALIELGRAAEAARELDTLETAVRSGEIDMTDTDREELANLRARIG